MKYKNNDYNDFVENIFAVDTIYQYVRLRELIVDIYDEKTMYALYVLVKYYNPNNR